MWKGKSNRPHPRPTKSHTEKQNRNSFKRPAG